MHYPPTPSGLPECKTALPPVAELDGMNLQHRIASPVTRLGRWWLVYSLVLYTAAALGVHLLVGSWSAVARHVPPLGLGFDYVLALGAAWAVLGWVARRVKRSESAESFRLAYYPLIACACLALGRLVYSPWGMAVFGLAVGYTAWLGYRISLHYAAWMAANPRIGPDEARPYREFARERGAVSLPVPLTTGWVVVFVAFAASTVTGAALADKPFGPGVAVLTFAAVLALACCGLAARTAKDGVGLVRGFRLAYRATASFLFYNRIACSAPGTFQSPGGSAERRGWHVTRAVVALGVALPVVTAFFVAVPLAQSGAAGRAGVVTGDPDPRGERDRGSPDALPGEVRLRPDERLIYDHLATPEEKAAYFYRIRYDRHAGLTPDEQPLPDSATAPKETAASAEDHVGRVTQAVFAGLTSKQARPVWAFTAALVVAFVFPAALVLLVTTVVGWPLLARFYRDLEAPDARLADPAVSPWERAAESLRASQHSAASREPHEGLIREKDHLFVGTTEQGEAPVLAPVALFDGHFQVVGTTGGGKTALFIAPRVTELIRRRARSIIVIDLKGEPLLFNTVMQEAARAKMRFRYFTNLKVPTFAFNPFTQRHLRKMSTGQRVQMLARGMGLYHGDGYGKGHYSSANARMLWKLLEKFPHEQSFARLMQHAELDASYQGLTKKAIQDGGHAVSVLQTLAGVPALNVASGDDCPAEVLANAIDLSDLFGQEPEVIYFYLKSDVDEDACRHIARLVLVSLFTAAGLRDPGQDGQVEAVVDEYQQAAGSQIKTITAQARSRGLHLLISHQSMSDLKTADGDFTKAVRDNTNGRVIFSTGDPDTLDEMVKLSGVEARDRAKWPVLVDDYLRGNTGPGASATGEVMTEAVQEPKLTRQQLQHMSAEQTLGFVQLRKNIGYSWFGGIGLVVRFRFPITAEEFENRKKEVWPGGPGTFTPNFDAPPTTDSTAARRKPKLPTGPVRPAQSARPTPPGQPAAPQPPAETADPGSLLDRLASEPAFGPPQSKPARKPKPSKKQHQPETPPEGHQ